jgi:putative (di)nucleoside polyphosphate hydrolase
MTPIRANMVPEGYRPCVGLALFNRQGLVFMGRRANRKLREHVAEGHEWQMPQGGIDRGEEPRLAALRELQEECNVTSVSMLAETSGWLTYDLPTDIATQSWKGRYRGQAQKWFAFRFEGDEAEINVLAPEGGHKPEFDSWRWEKLANTPQLIIPFKRPVYQQVALAFAHLAEK